MAERVYRGILIAAELQLGTSRQRTEQRDCILAGTPKNLLSGAARRGSFCDRVSFSTRSSRKVRSKARLCKPKEGAMVGDRRRCFGRLCGARVTVRRAGA